MSDGEKIWIAQNGERSGPFSVDDVRQWLTEGRYDAQALAWRKGMAEWAPLFSLFPERPAAATPPPPPRASAVFEAEDRPAVTHVLDEPTSAYRAAAEPPDEDLPPAPSMHWGVVLLLSIVTLGIYSAWAKVRTERYFYAHTRLAGASFEYLASPIAILKGRLIAYAVVICLVLSAQFMPALYLLMVLTIGLLMPALIVWSLRFRARNSAWRTSC